MERTNAETVARVERERESLNIQDTGFISNAIKLYIKYKELKIRLINRGWKTDIRYPATDICLSN